METICAIATPFGVGGIAVIRVSGDSAVETVDRLFRGKQRPADAASHTARFGHIVQPDGSVLDEVVCTVFRGPHSFTGEDTVEISCHGSLYIQQEILRLLVGAGARMADRGEFTKRAFLNGKMDLTQAEAVADLIASQSAAEKDIALSQLRGGVSEAIKALREKLLTFTSLLELELDFADHEELTFADRPELLRLITDAQLAIRRLTDTFRRGDAIKQGVQVAIAGAPNVGKSTLLNALLGEDRAIVSEISGTTRDTVEDTLTIRGVLVRLTDTAGIRETDDTIEQLGISRSRKALEKAHIVIELLDCMNPEHVLPEGIPHAGQRLLTVYNKADRLTGQDKHPASQNEDAIYISAKQGEIQPLTERLEQEVAALTEHSDGAMISNVRHYEALTRAAEALQRVQTGLEQQLSGELVSLDLHDALDALGEITGEVSSQEVLNTIFERFCIGK